MAPATSASEVRRGTLYGLSAYLIWGTFPLYFPLLDRAGAVEILLHRVLWSVVVCGLILTAVRGWPTIRPLLAEARRLVMLGAAALVIGANWGIYIYAVNSGQVVQAALGYFINPLVIVLLGVLVLSERLRRTQWVAVGIGAVAVIVLTIDYGGLPWIAISLALSFGAYGLLKNRVGRGLGALASLSAETALLAPFAAVVLLVLELRGAGTFTQDAPWHALLLASTGIITAIPLLCFGSAARRVPLTTIGLLQYVTPVLQFIIGVAIYRETMPGSRWIGFALVWVALVVLTADSWRSARRRRSDAALLTPPA